jgi:hypothetical protein
VKYSGIFLLFFLLLPGSYFSQSVNIIRPDLLIPAPGLHQPGKATFLPAKHGFHIRKSSRRGAIPVKKVAVVKPLMPYTTSGKQERLSFEYSGTNMGFEIRRYLHHRHSLPSKSNEPSSFSTASGKTPVSGYYMGTDLFDQFVENAQPGIIPDYSTTGLFGAYSVNNRTYLTFRNAFGARLELGFQSIKRYGLVFDFAFKAGFQYIEPPTESSSSRLGSYSPDQNYSWKHEPYNCILPSMLCSARMGWN